MTVSGSTQHAGNVVSVNYQRLISRLAGKGLGNIGFFRWAYKLFTTLTSLCPMPSAHTHGIVIHQNLFMKLHGPDFSHPFEVPSTEVILREVQEGQTVVDIGAHVGYYTCLLSKKVGPTGKVFAFEPGTHNGRMLRKNVAGNDLKNVTLFTDAVSNTTGDVLFYEHGAQSSIGHKQLSHLLPSGSVHTVALDEVLKDVPHVDFIKMDVEGSEAKAIQGMQRILSGNVSLFMEFFPGLITKAGGDPRAMIENLAALGFRFYDVHDGAQAPLTVTDIFTRYSVESRKVSNLTNLLCKKG